MISRHAVHHRNLRKGLGLTRRKYYNTQGQVRSDIHFHDRLMHSQLLSLTMWRHNGGIAAVGETRAHGAPI